MACSSGNASCISDSEVTSTANSPTSHPCPDWNGLKKLEDGDEEHVILKHRFYANLGSVARYCPVVAVHKNMHNIGSSRTRLEAFQRCAEAMKEKGQGDANVKNAWYGASKDDIDRILQEGFDCAGKPKNCSRYGLGLCLYSDNYVLRSIGSSVPDENGLRHVLVCCVILGNTEVVRPNSSQSCPSSDCFDSGVDNLKFPKNYIIWPSQLNTQVLPLYVLSVRLELHGKEFVKEPVKRPTSPWIPLNTLVSMLASRLPAHEVCLIRRLHNSYMERKITRQQMVFQVRLLTGDKLLLSAIRAFRAKQAEIRVGRGT